ncbi:MAG: hypothetical protein PVG48_03280 [Candidatus Bathyarchaeota archaeon]
MGKWFSSLLYTGPITILGEELSLEMTKNESSETTCAPSVPTLR